jgi:aminomethyltransferase
MITDLRARVGEGAGGTEVLIDYPKVAESALTAHLRKYVPPLFARWRVMEDGLVIGLYGPRARELATLLTETEPGAAEDDVREGSYRGERAVLVTTFVVGGEPGVDVFLPGDVADDFFEAALTADRGSGATPLGTTAFECLRIEAGRPRMGADMDEETLPGEAFASTGQMERVVSFTKGCYTGQEVVVRIAHRGHVNRHLRGLLLGGAVPPAHATRLVMAATGKEVGRITSTTFSPRMDQTVALGYVRREIEPGDTVMVGSVDGIPARVVELPFQSEA